MAERISWTAQVVALARAVGVSSELRDPSAGWVASPDSWASIDRLAARGFAPSAFGLLLRTTSIGLIDHNTIRMLAIGMCECRGIVAG